MPQKNDTAPTGATKTDKINVKYCGRKEEIILDLSFLSEKRIRFTPGSTALLSKQDAAKLIKENPRSFKVSMDQYEPEPIADAPKAPEEPREAGPEDIRAMLASMPNKQAIADYCKDEYGITLDPTVLKETLLDEAVQEIQDITDIG